MRVMRVRRNREIMLGCLVSGYVEACMVFTD